MGDLEDRLRQRADENKQLSIQREADYVYQQAVERIHTFVVNIFDTVEVLENYDWPAGVSPYYNGTPEDKTNHPDIEWGICHVEYAPTSEGVVRLAEDMAYWRIYKQEASRSDGYESWSSLVGSFILLRDETVGFEYFDHPTNKFEYFQYPGEPVRGKDRPGSFAEGWRIEGYTSGSDKIQSFSFNIHKFEDGLLKLRENAHKWATP